MDVNDLENMTERKILDAVQDAAIEAWKGNTTPWDDLCQLAYKNHPIFTDKQYLLQKVLEVRAQRKSVWTR